MESKKICMFDKNVTIFLGVFLVLFLLTAVAFMLLGISDSDWLIVGCILFFMWIILFLVIASGKSILNFIVFSATEISVKTILGKTLKNKKWSELKKIKVLDLHGARLSGKYICLNFSDSDISTQIFNDLVEEDYIILLINSKINLDLIRSYAINYHVKVNPFDRQSS